MNQRIDTVYESFLQAQVAESTALSSQSDLLDLQPIAMPHSTESDHPNAYLATFKCKGLHRTAQGEIAEMDGPWIVGIQFPVDYLRQVIPINVVCWFAPKNVFHPNIKSPLICLGKMPPGTGIGELAHQIFEMITFQRWTPHDPLNETAAQWCRKHSHRFPLDRRPLTRPITLQVRPAVPLHS